LFFQALPLIQRLFTLALKEITSEVNNYRTYSFLISYDGTITLLAEVMLTLHHLQCTSFTSHY